MREIISSSKFNSQLIEDTRPWLKIPDHGDIFFAFIGTRKSYLADQTKLMEFISPNRFFDKLPLLVVL